MGWGFTQGSGDAAGPWTTLIGTGQSESVLLSISFILLVFIPPPLSPNELALKHAFSTETTAPPRGKTFVLGKGRKES